MKNPNHLSFLNVGYIGQGKYKTKTDTGCSDAYIKWKNILNRCHYKKYQEKQPTYIGCTIIKEWYNFQNFAEWHEQNWKPHMEGWQLDKDILLKGNKMYSPETCCFVPLQINMLFVKANSKRGRLPIGVSKTGDKFQARIHINGKIINLGSFKTTEEAFNAYKTAKENYIKEVADKWRGQITEQVYNVLISYKVEIDD